MPILHLYKMPNPFNPDGRYDGSYEGMFETLVIAGDTVTVHLSSHEFLTPEDLAGQAADTAAHFDLATIEVENSLSDNKLPALVDTSRPGKVLDGQTVRVFLLADEKVSAAGLNVLFPGRLSAEAATELV